MEVRGADLGHRHRFLDDRIDGDVVERSVAELRDMLSATLDPDPSNAVDRNHYR